MRVIFAKFPLVSKILTLSHKYLAKLLITTNASGMPKTYFQGISSDLKQFFLVKNNLLTSVHNDTDTTDYADATDDYNRLIGIALLKAFSCAKNIYLSY